MRSKKTKADNDRQLSTHVNKSHNTNYCRNHCKAWTVDNALDEIVQNWHDQTLEVVDQTPDVEIEDLVLVVTNNSGYWTSEEYDGHFITEAFQAFFMFRQGRKISAIDWSLKKNTLTLVNYMSCLPPSAFMSGLSEKVNTKAGIRFKGTHGDGLKSASVTLKRYNMDFIIETQGNVYDMKFQSKDEFYGMHGKYETLHYEVMPIKTPLHSKIRDDLGFEYKTDTAVKITNLSRFDVHRYLFLCKCNVLGGIDHHIYSTEIINE